MAVVIKSVSVKGLGPLDEFTEELGKFNLIYGRNEQGKTFLVEFILKSLFRNVKVFRLRKIVTSGKVIVSGLEPGTSQFSPTSRKKLEHYWEENVQGMPTNIAQLLVIKGAELDFLNNEPGGVSKKIVKSFLSSEGILDRIQDKVQSTVQEAQIDNGEIIGANRGDIKNREITQIKLLQVERILEKVNLDYSGGNLTALLAQKRELQEKIADQEKAKRYTAYALAKSIKSCKEKNHTMEQRGLPESIKEHEELIRKLDNLKEAKEKLKESNEKSKHYKWVDAALIEYENYLSQGVPEPKRTYIYLSISLLIVAFVFTLTGLFLDRLEISIYDSLIYCGIGIGTLLGLTFGFLYKQQYQRSIKMLPKRLELKKLETSYQEIFDKELTDIAALKSHYKNIQKAYHVTQTIMEDVKELEAAIKLIKERISFKIDKLGYEGENETEWEEILVRLEKLYRENREQIQAKNLELANLDVTPDLYVENDPGFQYNKENLTRLIIELENVQDQITLEEHNLDVIKAEIRTVISDQSTTSWEILLEKLNKEKTELIEIYKELTSKICAGIILSQVIDNVRQQEDEKLMASLHSPLVQLPLFEITKRYKGVSLDGEKLLVSDDFEEFDVSNLSTAAREQVLLALRLGFAAKIMNEETAFLILDDAFQHSDWVRREYLIDTIVSLAVKGWQIIYFTMDDHIRDLFNELGPKTFPSEYQYYNLSS